MELSLKENNIIAQAFAYLEEIYPLLQQNLKPIIETVIQNEYFFVEFEIDVEKYSIQFRSYDTENEVIDEFYILDEKGILGGKDLLLNDEEYDEHPEQLKLYDAFYSQLDVKFLDWFVSAWQSVHGNQINIEAYFGFKDDLRTFNLITQKWISKEDRVE